MRHKVFISIVLTLLCIVIVPINAQEDTISFFDQHPLFEMMSHIPDNDVSRSDIAYYMDFRAVENAAEYIPTYESVDDWLNGDDPWVGFLDRWISVPPIFNAGTFLRTGETMPEVMGFDLLDVDYTFAVGALPDTTTIWRGEFNIESIIEAHLAREYTETEINGVQVMCGSFGCEEGFQQDLTNRNPANLFDPQFGRQPPFAIYPNTLISVFGLPSLEEAIDAYSGEVQSLAKAEDFRTLGEAMLNPDIYNGDLVQAQFLSSRYFAESIDFITLEGSTLLPGVDIEEFQDIVSDYGDLPQSQLAVFADRQEGDTQVAIIGLLYDNEADAQIAMDEVTTRLTSYSGYLRTRDSEPFIDAVEGAIVNDGYVYQSPNTGLYVAVISVDYPMPEGRADFGAEDSPPRSVLIFSRWIQGIYTRGFYLLWQMTLPE